MKRASPLLDVDALLTADRVRGLVALRKALAAKNHIHIVEAIQKVGELKVLELEPELVVLFEHFAGAADEEDKRCLAKTAIVKALRQLGIDRPALFLEAIHTQEPVFPDRDDATLLRVEGALALTDFGHPDAAEIMVDLLVDPMPDVRITAVRCLLAVVPHQAYLLLRLKVQLGDKATPVLDECFAALLETDPRRSIPFVGEFLGSRNDDTRTAAAIALGESRQQKAFELLRDRWQHEHDEGFRGTLLHAVAMLRQDYATRFLVSLIEAGKRGAADALLALAPYRGVESIRNDVAAAVAKAQSKELQDLFQRKFRV